MVSKNRHTLSWIIDYVKTLTMWLRVERSGRPGILHGTLIWKETWCRMSCWSFSVDCCGLTSSIPLSQWQKWSWPHPQDALSCYFSYTSTHDSDRDGADRQDTLYFITIFFLFPLWLIILFSPVCLIKNAKPNGLSSSSEVMASSHITQTLAWFDCWL